VHTASIIRAIKRGSTFETTRQNTPGGRENPKPHQVKLIILSIYGVYALIVRIFTGYGKIKDLDLRNTKYSPNFMFS
jgi:hypothetical protein